MKLKLVIMQIMFRRSQLPVITLFIALAAACSSGPGPNTNTAAAETPKPAVTPSGQFTDADIAKLKWLEGSWKGTGGEKPFFERIRFDGSTMIVEVFADESMKKTDETSRFELKDGEFGNTVNDQRSAASSITDTSVQFVPAAALPGGVVKGSTFRFERLDDGTWNAVLVIPATSSRPSTEKAYKMEPFNPGSK